MCQVQRPLCGSRRRLDAPDRRAPATRAGAPAGEVTRPLRRGRLVLGRSTKRWYSGSKGTVPDQPWAAMRSTSPRRCGTVPSWSGRCRITALGATCLLRRPVHSLRTRSASRLDQVTCDFLPVCCNSRGLMAEPWSSSNHGQATSAPPTATSPPRSGAWHEHAFSRCGKIRSTARQVSRRGPHQRLP